MTATNPSADYQQLSSYRRCVERIAAAWPGFTAQRLERLQQGLFGAPAEKVAENILEDLFTHVLDWNLADVNLQVGRADIILSALGFKRLVLEVKRPSALSWNRAAVDAALDQAWKYAAEQKVNAIAVSDGQMLYAADVTAGGLKDRLYVPLDAHDPPLDLWWVSVHGIYRSCPELEDSLPHLSGTDHAADSANAASEELLHRKYLLPARCFAFVGRADNQATWKLPYVLADGTPDLKC